MTDTFTLTLDNPLTEEQWDMIEDVDFDRTDRIWFHTKHGKEVEFVKVIRCKDCKYWEKSRINYNEYVCYWGGYVKQEDDFCSWAERKEE